MSLAGVRYNKQHQKMLCRIESWWRRQVVRQNRQQICLASSKNQSRTMRK